MIKGIPPKILAFENFLEENPEWRDKVVLMQIAVPTRTDVLECKIAAKFSILFFLFLAYADYYDYFLFHNYIFIKFIFVV